MARNKQPKTYRVTVTFDVDLRGFQGYQVEADRFFVEDGQAIFHLNRDVVGVVNLDQVVGIHEVEFVPG